jgi:hypothetical protein
MAATRTKASYDVHPTVKMNQEWIASLKARTGRSLPEWMDFIAKKGPKSEEARRAWLKDECGLGTVAAWSLAERSFGRGVGDDDPESYLRSAAEYVAGMYRGKEGLRPIHDRLVALGRALGKDVKVCPCQTIVPLYRQHVFAQIKPSTKTRLDLGFALGPLLKEGKKVPARLIDTGGFAKKDRITHRIPLADPADVDAEVERWLKKAYDLDA